MCTANNGTLTDKMNLYSSNKGTVGKINTIANPAGAATHKYLPLDEKVNDYLEPPEAPPPPPELQEGKDPDMTAITKARKNYYKANTGTLLTGPSGVTRSQQAFGATLLGG